jgi:protease-4
MSDKPLRPGQSTTVQPGDIVIRVESQDSSRRNIAYRMVTMLLVVSLMLNVLFVVRLNSESFSDSSGIQQTHHSGNPDAADRIAIIRFTGTIMPPFTGRWLKQIRDAQEDDSIKGVLLEVDSPGGLVADSHQIYHELQKLRAKKPIYVAMKRLAASGGYYISMGSGPEGRIFAEPTTWTGSIGVIIPRYNAKDLAAKVGISSEPLATGPLKDSLNPFRDLSEQETEVWSVIMDESFSRFVSVIDDNRSNLNEEQVRSLATGQIYTASQAVENGMVDEIGFVEDALAALATSLQLDDYQVVRYSTTGSLLDVLLGATAKSQPTFSEQLLDASTPRAMYYCSWNPWVPMTEPR